jgi:hypothetical protein
MNVVWVRIISWHALRTEALGGRTLCGRTAAYNAEMSDELPAGKSCETCLRGVARKTDTPPPYPDTDEVPS